MSRCEAGSYRAATAPAATLPEGRGLTRLGAAAAADRGDDIVRGAVGRLIHHRRSRSSALRRNRTAISLLRRLGARPAPPRRDNRLLPDRD